MKLPDVSGEHKVALATDTTRGRVLWGILKIDEDSGGWSVWFEVHFQVTRDGKEYTNTLRTQNLATARRVFGGDT